jgi:hypothetical protein
MIRLARHLAAFIGTRILAALEAHEETDATDWEQVRRDMRHATYTELVEWREANLEPADIEADFKRWAVEPAKEPQR